MLNLLQLDGEMAQYRAFECDAVACGNRVATLEDVAAGSGDDADMVVGVDATRNCQTQ